VVTVVEDFPELAQRGRVHLQQRATTAKIVGQFAVAEGRRRFQTHTAQSAPPMAAQRGARGSPGLAGRAQTSAPVGRPGGAAPREAGTPTPPSADLGIPGYDSLSASQVVQRLASLSKNELDAVEIYETATRGRRTILSRIHQLQQD
jgi:hypothetical protein